MTTVPEVQISPGGPKLSKIIQGYWRLAEWQMSAQQLLSFINGHLELGITSVDHAHVYGKPPCESLFGESLKLDSQLRGKIEIISKCGINPPESGNVAHYNATKEAMIASVETSLKRLGTDYLDVLLIHRPDFLIDADEVADAFELLKNQGKVKYFGVSNFSVGQFDLLQSRLDFPLITNQIELNPVNLDVLECGLLEYLQKNRVSPMAWSCLGGGRVFSEDSEQMQSLRSTLQNLVEELGAESIDQVIYAWVMKLPCRPLPILGSGHLDRVKAAVGSINLNMNHEQWYRVWQASNGHPVP